MVGSLSSPAATRRVRLYRTDQDQVEVGRARATSRSKRDVDALGVECPDVERHRRRREVGGPGMGMRNSSTSTPFGISSTARVWPRVRARSGEQTTTASLCSRRRSSLATNLVRLRGGSAGREAIVGDVVEAGPSVANGESRVGGVVDPQQWRTQAELTDGIEDLALQSNGRRRARATRGNHFRGRSTWMRGWTCLQPGGARP